MVTAEVEVATHGRVMVVTLNRPRARNAVNPRMARTIARHLDEFDDSQHMAVAVLHGASGTFSAGMDLKHFHTTGERPLDARRGGGGVVRRPPRKPIIAAVEGWALGLGFEMALACDVVVAADDATFGLPEVTHGLVAAGGGAIRLPTRLPRAVAMEMLLTGRPLPASRLWELGLVNHLTARDETLDKALQVARQIADVPMEAARLTKEIATETRDWPEEEMFARQEQRVATLMDRRGKEPG